MSREQKGVEDPPCHERRRLLQLAGSVAVGGWILGCPSQGPAPPIEIALADLPAGERVRVLHGDDPIELIRTEEGVTARSLWCTHLGCEVKWAGGDEVYRCPCHEGVYDARGRVVAGPPPRNLKAVPIQVTETSVIIGAPEPQAAG